MRKLLTAVTFSLSLGLVTGANAQPIGIGTSPQGTLTYGLGAAVAKALQEGGGLQSRVQPSTGTTTMIPLVNSGEVDIGFCNSLELYESFHGTGTFDKRPNPKLRAVAVLFPIRVGLFVKNDSPIKTVQDLKGKTIAYGFTSQEIIKTTIDAMLATGGLSAADTKTVLVPNVIRGVDELVGGRVDMTTFAIGTAKVAEADASVGIRYLDLGNDATKQAALRKWFRTAYLAKVEPAPNRPGVRAPIETMFYDYTLFTNADVPAEKIKKILEILTAKAELLGQTQPQFKDMKVERMYGSVDVPYHEGALAFFREKSIKETK